jgi:site-specific DNA-methyltransferase (adenine-specific)
MIKITNEDNMQLMARYEDNHFDLAIVDPPYGIGEDGGKQCLTLSNSHLCKTANNLNKKGWDV